MAAPVAPVIPVNPDWREVMLEFRRRGMSDHDVLDELSKQGVAGDRSSLCYLRSGRTRRPHYEVGAALLNLLSR